MFGGEGDGGGGALVGLADEDKLALVVFGDDFGDRETQSRSAGAAGAGRVYSVEAVEDVGEVFFGDADAGVLDGGDELGGGCGEGDGDHACWGVVNGVGNEVGEEAGELIGVGLDGWSWGVAVGELEGFVLGDRLLFFDDVF